MVVKLFPLAWSIDNWQEQDRVINESFDLFGDRIAIIHAKDFAVEGNALKQVRSGQGQMNHKLLMGLLRQRKPFISILLEEASEETAEESARFLNGVE